MCRKVGCEEEGSGKTSGVELIIGCNSGSCHEPRELMTFLLQIQHLRFTTDSIQVEEQCARVRAVCAPL